MSRFSSFCAKVFVVSTLALSSSGAFADDAATKAGDVDLSALTSNISFSGVIVAVMAIAGSIITLLAAIAGVKHVLKMVRGA
ncbi:hypothetical protein KKJ25_02870 [Xenorhabdus bovienii]|uniref:Phage-related membrane protein n=1 Tax=Xenorhabdus bovienii TaxID=40576 RepID=A0AAJ1N057_XENBV|nr:hypothetical protein [Xenorhabdus bovienii]MDE1477672.1 hypothetical protein [Xenorhabdus bovienii]MDE1493933.1 hypothetical protein [Xenorhabdus bovienii]MDE9471946.1 hypothetical protein [Xenorhabdus bovienii]MDE9509413.1 hypothetical protein [Xenorhabdus bovienii]MDE9521058.1 hypothetical protein [Xenorhabdus bovienii]